MAEGEELEVMPGRLYEVARAGLLPPGHTLPPHRDCTHWPLPPAGRHAAAPASASSPTAPPQQHAGAAREGARHVSLDHTGPARGGGGDDVAADLDDAYHGDGQRGAARRGGVAARSDDVARCLHAVAALSPSVLHTHPRPHRHAPAQAAARAAAQQRVYLVMREDAGDGAGGRSCLSAAAEGAGMGVSLGMQVRCEFWSEANRTLLSSAPLVLAGAAGSAGAGAGEDGRWGCDAALQREPGLVALVLVWQDDKGQVNACACRHTQAERWPRGDATWLVCRWTSSWS